MAMDMFIKIGEVGGEAQDKDHKGEIDVLAWSWGLSNSGTTHTGSGGGGGKANFQDLSLTKYIDASSYKLGVACATGEHFKKAQLVVRKSGGKAPLEYITILMEDVMVTSVSTGGSGGEDRLTENIALNFANVNFTYKEQKPDGTTGPDLAWKWDIPANTGSTA